MKINFKSVSSCLILTVLFSDFNLYAKENNNKKNEITKVKGVENSVLISKKQKDKDLSVDLVIALAYSKNPQLKAAIAAKLAADEQLAQAFSEFFPTITSKFQTNLTETSQEQTPDTKKDRAHKSSVGVDLILNLYGDGTLSKIDRANLMLISERYNYIKTEQNILMKTVSAFIDIWSAAEQVKIYTNIRDNFKECMEFSEEQFKAGFSKIQDLEAFRSSYADAEYKLINAKAALKIAKANLKQYICEQPKGIVSIPEEDYQLPTDINLLLEEAKKKNAALLVEKYKADAVKIDVDIKFSDLPPYLNLEGGVSREFLGRNTNTHNGVETDGKHAKNDSYNIGLSVTMPIWKNSTAAGTNPYSSIRKAKMDAEAQKFNAEAMEKSLLSEVSKAWYNLIASKAQIEQSIAAVKSAEISVDGYKEQERLGSSSATDVVYNENKLLEARLQYVEARKKYILSIYQIKALLSEIKPNFEKYSIKENDITSNENKVRHAPVNIHI